MDADIPIDFQEHAVLTELGIPQSSIDFRSCTLESDHYVCARIAGEGHNTVAIVDLHNDNKVVQKSMSADSAIVNPDQLVIAVRAQGTIIQVFQLETKSILKSFTMEEPVTFWKWLSPSVLGLVTATSIYHWEIFDGDTARGPVRVTGVHASVAPCQIINYVASADLRWTALTGLTQDPSGRIVGRTQLYNRDRNISQAIDGFAAGFALLRLEGATSDSKLFVVVNRLPSGAGQMHIIETDHDPANPKFEKKTTEVFFPPNAPDDFPLSVQISNRYGVIYVLTKFGFIHLFDLETGTNLFVNRISADPLFTAAPFKDHSGIIAINKRGQVLSVTVSETRLVPHVLNKLANTQLALALASRGGLPGADNLYEQSFNQFLASGNYAEAAKVAAQSPRGILRTSATIARLRAVQAPPGTISPLLQYFSILIDQGSLNKEESLELVRPLLQQGKKQLLEKWLTENKLTASEELGDVIKPHDTALALAVYLRAKVPVKVVAGLAELGQFDKILPYCTQTGYTPDYSGLVQNVARVNPDKAAELATQLVADPQTADKIDVAQVADVFLAQNLIPQGTAFLLDALKDDKPDQGDLQTRLLQVNLQQAPQVADAILGNGIFSHYDRLAVARLCEQAGLYQRALEHYTDTADLCRVMSHVDSLNPEWLVNFFGTLSADQTFACLRALLQKPSGPALQAAVQVATKYSELLGPAALVKLFEEFHSAEGVYYYLASIVNVTHDGELVFKYIEAAAKLGQLKEVERVVRDNNFYDAAKVKAFLKEARLPDQLPLIIVCDRFDFVHDLVLYLYQNQLFKFIEVYVQKVNPSRTPAVVAALLDVDCPESTIQALLASVVGQVPLKELVAAVEQRSRLKLLLPYLESCLAGGSQDQEIYNALAKIYIDSNNNPEKFLRENDQYDTLVVGQYCEKRDPFLAYIAYEKGHHDDELLRITNDNAMFKYQARYLLARSDLDLWLKVLTPENVHRRQVVDQVIGVAVPESTAPDAVSVVVKAFMAADMPTELLELLEKIILEPSPFSDNPSLQGLLMLTAMKADPARVMGYVERLDAYDVTDVAETAVAHGLYEEAFAIYKRHGHQLEALRVLTENILSLDRAAAFAEELDTPAAWAELGSAQLKVLRVSDAIESYLRAGDASHYEEVIECAEQAGKHEELLKYLQMARKQIRDPKIDGQLLMCYARLEKFAELEAFLQTPHAADTEAVADKLFQEKNYRAAKLLYSAVANWAKLASTLVFLGDHQAAVECARKASNISVWKQVHDACIEAKEFRLAQICGLSLIVHAEELPALTAQYEYHGLFSELIALFEQGLGLERAHMGMFTELAILYSRYQPDKLMEHLKLFWSRLNMPKVLAACEEAHLWPELVFLYCHYDEWDNAALAMMEHSPDAFDHAAFKEIVAKVANLEIYYKAVNFYVAEQPALLLDILQVMAPRIDVPRVVRMFEKSDNLPMIKPFLISVQEKNLSAVNNAYHELLIEEENYKALRDSVDSFDRFDAIELAQKLEKHEVIFFRQLAAYLYRKNKKWIKSISLCKEDKLWFDAIETAALSGKPDVAEDLLRYFVDTGNKECYVATLYACYDLLGEDIVEELCWLHGLADYTMPYRISLIKEKNSRLAALEKDNEERKKKEKEANGGEEDLAGAFGSRLLLTQGGAAPVATPLVAQPSGWN